MYLKDKDLYIKTEQGFELVQVSLSESGNLCLTRSANPMVLKKRPVGAKPVVGHEVIAQLGLTNATDDSATLSSGASEHSDAEKANPVVSQPAQHSSGSKPAK